MTMAPPVLQEEGWPLGLQLVNAREGLAPGRDRELLSGRSVSLNTLITASPNRSASTDSSSSSDLDSESTGSFFHERSTTFGTLIGASSSLDLSKRSSRTRRSLRHTENSNTATIINRSRRSRPSLLWSFSVCCRDSRDVEVVKNYGSATGGAQPLSHFLAGERRKPDGRWRRRQLSRGECFGPYDGLGLTGLTPEWNTLFVDGRIAPPPHPPPRSSPWSGSDVDQGSRSSVIFSWICVKPS